MARLSRQQVAMHIANIEAARTTLNLLAKWASLPSSVNDACELHSGRLADARNALYALLPGEVEVEVEPIDAPARRGWLSVFGGE